MIIYYIDHDSADSSLVSELRRLGVTLVTTQEAGNETLADEAQLEFAAASNFVLYTANVGDFSRLHRAWMAAGRSHPGIILRFEQRMPVGLQVVRLAAVANGLAPEQLRDRTFYIDAWPVS